MEDYELLYYILGSTIMAGLVFLYFWNEKRRTKVKMVKGIALSRKFAVGDQKVNTRRMILGSFSEYNDTEIEGLINRVEYYRLENWIDRCKAKGERLSQRHYESYQSRIIDHHQQSAKSMNATEARRELKYRKEGGKYVHQDIFNAYMSVIHADKTQIHLQNIKQLSDDELEKWFRSKLKGTQWISPEVRTYVENRLKNRKRQ